MKKILIDTNKYLDFYRYKKENKEILEKISLSNNIIMSYQIIREFKRNRIIVIKELLKSIEARIENMNRSIYNLEPVGIFDKDINILNEINTKLTNEIKNNLSNFKETINDMLIDEDNDEVFSAFKKIISNKNTKIIQDNDELYNLAIKRNNLGGVPRSDKSGNKYSTVCDEYIWESLLLNSKWDILFVTRDNTYFDNYKILEEEYYQRTGKQIKFFNTISMALIECGEEISEESLKREQQELLLLNKFNDVTELNLNNKDEIYELLLTLTEREEQVIKLRFGLFDGVCRSLEEIGSIFGVTETQIKKIEDNGLRKLKSRSTKN